MMRRQLVFVALVAAGFGAISAFAGGPVVVGGPAVGTRPAFGIDGKPFT